MPLQIDTEICLIDHNISDKKYLISPAHRRNQRNKSQWVIDMETEVLCFVDSQLKLWVEDSCSWGIIKNGNSLQVLGVNTVQEDLKLAKFVSKNNNNIWHGYPADYCRNTQDRPHMDILKKWREERLIEKHQIVKIKQGKPCNL